MAECYGSPFIAIEGNGIGKSTLDTLYNVYQYENFVRMDKQNRIGIQSHVQIKSKACLWAQEFMTTPELNIYLYDINLLDEMDKFIKKDTAQHVVYKAVGSTDHDDHMMAFVWGLWVMNPNNIEYYYTVVEYMESGIGKTLPKYVAPLYSNIDDTPVDIKLDTKEMMNMEWRKEKQDIQDMVDSVMEREEEFEKLNWDGTKITDDPTNEVYDDDIGFFM